jgi:hypothetical protein
MESVLAMVANCWTTQHGQDTLLGDKKPTKLT